VSDPPRPAVSGDFRQDFSADYAEARGKFLAAAAAAGVPVQSYRNPAPGPGGQPLCTDVARLGPANAEKVVIVASSTHGVEGFAGSPAQIAWLRAKRPLPPRVGMVLVHAINPYGFAWLSRVNEDNIDINRNFIDHGNRHPANPLYDAVAAAVLPAEWDRPAAASLEAALGALAKSHGPMAPLQAFSGQYDHPDGVFYGGRQPCWSNRTLAEIVRQHLPQAKLVAYIDMHTGLGPYGYGEAINYHQIDSPEYRAGFRWYGPSLTSPHAGTAASPVNSGKTGYGVAAALPDALVSCTTLEFGTYRNRPLAAIAADGWLRARGRAESDLGRAIKREMRDAFYPDRDDWKELVAVRSAQVMRQAVEGLAAE